MVEFGILGPLEITAGGQPLPVRGARTRAVLAMLLVHANQVVSADRLTDELWAGQPAAGAAASLQVRVSQLRKALRTAGETERLVTRPPCHGRYLAAHLPRARYFEQPGDHLLWLGDTDAMFGQIRAFLGATGDTPGPDAETDRSSPSPAAPAAG